MKLILSLLFSASTSLTLNAQASFLTSSQPAEVSVYKGIGSKNESTSISHYPSDNGLTAGYFSGSTNFGPHYELPIEFGSSSHGQDDVFVVKRHSSGNIEWVKTIGGSGNDRALGIESSYSSHTVVGYFEGTVDFDPGVATHYITSEGDKDVFILNLDLNGNFLWVTTMGSDEDDIAYSVDMNHGGEIVVTGEFRDGFRYKNGTYYSIMYPSNGGSDIFVVKLDEATGNVNWLKRYGGVGDDFGKDVNFDDNHDVLLTGNFKNVVDFDPGPGVHNHTALAGNNLFNGIYIQKLDNNGIMQWTKSIYGPGGMNFAGALYYDTDYGAGDGAIYVTGNVSGNTDIDPGPGNYMVNPIGPEYSAGFILKLNKNSGAFIWGRSFDGPYTEFGKDIFCHLGVLFISGTFRDILTTAIGAPGFPESFNEPGYSSFITSYNTNGDYIRTKTLGNVKINALNAHGHGWFSVWLEFVGEFHGPTNFSDIPTSPLVKTSLGIRDAFSCTWAGTGISYLMPIDETIEAQDESFKTQGSVYPNPSSGSVSIDFDNSKVTQRLITIVDVFGKMVFEQDVTDMIGRKTTIDPHLASGTYLLQVLENDGLTSTQKLIIQQ